MAAIGGGAAMAVDIRGVAVFPLLFKQGALDPNVLYVDADCRLRRTTMVLWRGGAARTGPQKRRQLHSSYVASPRTGPQKILFSCF
jgi:hypothetical protein